MVGHELWLQEVHSECTVSKMLPHQDEDDENNEDDDDNDDYDDENNKEDDDTEEDDDDNDEEKYDDDDDKEVWGWTDGNLYVLVCQMYEAVPCIFR